MIADSSRPGVGDELVTRIVPLENVPARDLAPLLRQMMDAGSSVMLCIMNPPTFLF